MQKHAVVINVLATFLIWFLFTKLEIWELDIDKYYSIMIYGWLVSLYYKDSEE